MGVVMIYKNVRVEIRKQVARLLPFHYEETGSEDSTYTIVVREPPAPTLDEVVDNIMEVVSPYIETYRCFTEMD